MIQSQAKFQIPVIPLMILLLGFIALLLIWHFRPQARALSGEHKAPLALESFSAEVVQTTASGSVIKKSSMAFSDPRYWQLAQIARIERQGLGTLIVFNDASARELSPYLLTVIPHELRLRLEYVGAYE